MLENTENKRERKRERKRSKKGGKRQSEKEWRENEGWEKQRKKEII